MEEETELQDISSKSKSKHKKNYKEKFSKDTNSTATKYSRPLAIFVLLIILANAILKLKIAFDITYFIITHINSLYGYIVKFFPNNELISFLYYINYVFFFFGIVILFIEPFLHVYIRVTFIISDNRRLLNLILGKLMIFIVLGFVPESTMLMFQFNNKNNIVLPFYIAKLYMQPLLLVALIIYALFLLLSFKGREIGENMKKHLMIYQGVLNRIANSSYFKWNSVNVEKERNMDDSDDEDLINKGMFVIKRRYVAFIIFFGVLFSPVLNGIFNYGFNVFFFTESITCLLFKLDIVLSFIFTLVAVKLIEK